MSGIYDNMAESFRERRAAQRQDVVRRIKDLMDDVSRLEREKELTRKSLDALIVTYVVDRLAKRDPEGVDIFRNMLPDNLHAKIDETKEMYEYIHGITPTL